MNLRRLTAWLRVTPRREFPFTMTVVILAVAIPTAGLLFFMNRAMNAEGERLHSDLTEARRHSLESVRNHIRQALEARLRAAAENANSSQPPPERFQAVMQHSEAAGCLILNAQGAVAFPVLTLPDTEEESTLPAEEAMNDLEQAAVRAGHPPDAEMRLKLTEAVGRDALAPTGRSLRGQALLAALMELPPSHPRRTELLTDLQRLTADRTHAMPTAQRLFLAEELERMGAKVALPQAAAESFSLQMAGVAAVPQEAGTLIPAAGEPDIFSIRLKGAGAVLFLRQGQLHAGFMATAAPLLAADGLTPRIGPHEPAPEIVPLAAIALGPVLPGWDIAVTGADAAAAIAGRIAQMKRLYLVSAIGGCLLIGALAGWAIRRFALRARDTQMKQDFLSLVSHELKTPLTSIRLFVDSLAAGGLEEPERARTYLDFIRRENERLSRLVENFLTFSRIESGRMVFDFHIVHPDDIADAVRAAVAGRVDVPGCDFQTSSDAGLPLVKADPGSLTTALVNLVDNALKYTREDKRIAFTVTRSAAGVVFAVTDNGIGMSTETLQHLGEKFYRDRAAAAAGQKGFGLGLNIVRSIVAAHNGTLETASTVGAGSRFAITLPACLEESP